MATPARALPGAPARRPAQSPPRRRSGLAAPPLPRRAPVPAPGLRARQRGGAVLDHLLRGRAWVVLIGLLLAGIVFLNVSVLEVNRGIAQTGAAASSLERANSGLRAQLATVGSAEGIQRAAEARGYVLPQPGDIGFLRVNPRSDAGRAASQLAAASARSAGNTSATTSPALTGSTSTPAVPSAVAPRAGNAASPSGRP